MSNTVTIYQKLVSNIFYMNNNCNCEVLYRKYVVQTFYSKHTMKWNKMKNIPVSVLFATIFPE